MGTIGLGSPIDVATRGRAELPDSQPTQMSGANGWQGGVGRIERTGTAVERRGEDGDVEKKKRIRYPAGLLGRARGGKWPVYG